MGELGLAKPPLGEPFGGFSPPPQPTLSLSASSTTSLPSKAVSHCLRVYVLVRM